MKINKLLFLLVIIFLASCKKKENNIKAELTQIIGTKIYEIDSLKNFSINKGFFKKKKKNETKIITFIDGSCGSCVYELEKWKELLENKDFKNTPFLCYINIFNKAQLSHILNEINFVSPVIADFTNQFYIKNNLREDKFYQTFLVDDKNNIVLSGNPNTHESIRKLYVKEIKKMKK